MWKWRTKQQDPHVAIRKSVSSLRTLGTVFLFVGVVLSVMFGGLVAQRAESQEIVASMGVFLIGPGVLYHVFAAAVKRRESQAARAACWTAAMQSAWTVIGITVAILGILPPMRLVLVPMTITVFFLPALIAQVVEIRTALAAIRLLPELGKGFEAVVADTKLAPLAVSNIEVAEAQPSDNLRGK